MADLFKKGDLVMVLGEVQWVDKEGGQMKVEMPRSSSIYINQTDAVMHRAAFEIGDRVSWDRESGGWTYTGSIKAIDKDNDNAWVLSEDDHYHTVSLALLRRPYPDFDEVKDEVRKVVSVEVGPTGLIKAITSEGVKIVPVTVRAVISDGALPAGVVEEGEYEF